MARLVKFADSKKEAFLQALRQGSRRGKAAESVGVTYETIRLHMHRDEGFKDAVDQAEMDANELVEGALFKAAVGGNVVAIQVWLYNRAPDRWADRRNLRIGGDPDNPIDVRTMSDDELRRHTERLANRIAGYIGGAVSDNGDGGQ